MINASLHAMDTDIGHCMKSTADQSQVADFENISS